MIPPRGYSALRRGRWSSPFAEYFVSFCTRGRRSGLEQPELTGAILRHFDSLAKDGAGEIRTGVVMPDHIHLLARLNEDGDLAAVVRRCKGPLTPLLRERGLGWQAGYHDHRLRPDNEVLPVFLYIFLNPYRAGLAHAGERWPGYRCCDEDWAWFEELTDSGHPFPEWLERWDGRARGVGA